MPLNAALNTLPLISHNYRLNNTDTYAACTVWIRLWPVSCAIRAMLMASQMVSSGVRGRGAIRASLSIFESLMVVLCIWVFVC